jgi:AraC family transcriptional regulator of adaptative response/methylated-DNA-[protein]-cysteine methyltransferase
MLDQDAAFAAFDARDRTRDGAFVAAVRTTGIYCKPSCPARRPRRENVAFYADGAAARVAGYRPCLRCRPDEADRDRQAVARALAVIETAEGVPSLAELAEAVGYSGPHFQRLFRRDVGISPAAYARALRAGRLEAALQQEGKVTEAIYEAGYGAASRAYADAGERLGMAPATWRAGGAGETICHAVVATSLGPLLVAATERGLCRIAFDEDAEMLRGRFPEAALVEGGAQFEAVVRAVVALVDDPARPADLPLDVRGTAFQQAVWQLCRAGGDGRAAGGGAGRRDGVRRQCAGHRHPLPPRAARRRQPWRLCLWAGAQEGAAGAREREEKLTRVTIFWPDRRV